MAYGFEFRDDGGNVTLSNTATGMRLVQLLELDAGESGTYSVPDFDLDKGLYTIIPVYRVVNQDDNSFPYGYTSDLNSPGDPGAVPMTYRLFPSLNWDNVTKIFTVDPPDPGETETMPTGDIGVLLPVKIYFIHYE